MKANDQANRAAAKQPGNITRLDGGSGSAPCWAVLWMR